MPDPPGDGDRRRRWRTLALVLACLAALPQLVTYWSYVHQGQYPGSAFKPRLDAMLEVSAVAARHGPILAMGGPRLFRAVDRIQPDLGLPALADVLGRLRGEPISLRTLGAINLAFLGLALFSLIAALPAPHRWGLVPLFLLVPLYSAAYVSADIPTIHGAFAVLAFVVPLTILRTEATWVAAGAGVLLVVVFWFRAVYGYYGALTLLAMMAWMLLLRRDRTRVRVLRGTMAALLATALLSVPWSLALRARRRDPRLPDKDAIGTHDVFKPLISGIGWTPNRWGIAPWDPRVAQFIGDRLGVDPIPIFTNESEKRARVVYASLWREAPGHLAKLYLARIPRAFSDDFFGGAVGTAAWLLAAAGALAWSWRRGESDHSPIVLGSAVMILCLVAQSVLLDPRLLYAYPLRVMSALGLGASLTSIVLLGSPLVHAYRSRRKTTSGGSGSSAFTRS